MSDQLSAIKRFRELHESGCFVLPNPWDIGSAIYLEHLGFKALATTSAGFAFSRALSDSVAAVPRDLMLEHFREMAAATSLPVNADFQTGYADEPDDVATNVALCVATGIAGLSIEDATGKNATPLYEFDLAVERIKAARAAIDASGISVVLTARCEAWLVGQPEPFNESLKKLVAFADVGADCLYAPGVTDPAEIEAIVKAVSPKPVNVLVSRFNSDLTVTRLSDLGVRRISVGSAMACVAWGGFMRSARAIAETGSFQSFADGAAYAEINDLFETGFSKQ
ncbi:MAG: isocitrate lyase/phosphoenolpyruvate mutase family protein [Acidobacteriota bacterium]